MADEKLTLLTEDTAPSLTDLTYTVKNPAGTPLSRKGTHQRILGLAGGIPGGRLTLTSGTPVTTSDVIGATSIYYTPFIHNGIELWDGNAWIWLSFSQYTLALGTLTSGKNYDVFAYINSGALALEVLAWTDDSTRATGISLQDGRYCKTGDKTRLFLGTFRTTSTTQTEDSAGGTTTQVGGKRFLWNMYNRVDRTLAVKDTTDNWAYTTVTWRQANNAAGNKVEFVLGLSEDIVDAAALADAYLLNNATQGAMTGVGVDVTNAVSGFVQPGFNADATNAVYAPFQGRYSGYLAAGYHYLAWIEKGTSGTCTFLGDNGADGTQCGMNARIKS